MALIWKKVLFLTSFAHFLVTVEKTTLFQHISYLHKYTYLAHPFDFFAIPILQKITKLLYIVSLWYESWLILIRAILEQSMNN